MLRLHPRLLDETPTPLLDAGIPPHLARILWARGIRTGIDAEVFLSPSLKGLFDPLLLFGMEQAVNRICRAMETDEPIMIYGDYDVDGVCATAILVEALLANGAHADYYIPSRHREGYGLNRDAIRDIAKGASLLITVDCGITSIDEAAYAKSLGLDLIITDHHEPPKMLPEAVAIVNPLLGKYPFRRLCGAGVAFKLGQALFGLPAMMKSLDLVALATVADLVPLLSENRILVHFGLKTLQNAERPGLRALIAKSGLSGKVLTAGHLGFQLGPRINAGGRLSDANRNVTLLLTQDEKEAKALAEALDLENALRQRMEGDILAQADGWVMENVDFLKDNALVVVGEGWNAGVVGLVASRLTETYAWPSVVLTENEGMLTGSARTVPGVNIHAALVKCQDLFVRFGGHTMAAGMTLPAKNLPAFRERLNKAIREVAEPDAFIPSLSYDLSMELSEVSIGLIHQLERLAPTGLGNPNPVFHLAGAEVLEARSVGVGGKHLKLRLEKGGAALDGIAFGQGHVRATLPRQVDALFSPTINEYMGKVSAQLEVSKLLPHAPAKAFWESCQSRADDFDCALLDAALADKYEIPDLAAQQAYVAQCLTESIQGTLFTLRTLGGAKDWAAYLMRTGLSDRADFAFEKTGDPRRFNTVLAMPAPGAEVGFTRVIPLDDQEIPGAIAAFLPTDEDLRNLYRVLKQGFSRFFSESALSEACKLKLATVRLGLLVLEELSLLTYRPIPFEAALLTPRKCDLADSALLKKMRRIAATRPLPQEVYP